MTSSLSTSTTVSALESYRTEMIDHVNRATDALISKLKGAEAARAIGVKIPTFEQAQDPRNKDGANLTARGAEILYRLFDDGAGYNRASKALGITQTAARNRKGLWEKLGGLKRTRTPLDIDE